MLRFLKLLNLGRYRRYHKTPSSSTIYALSSGHGKCAIAVVRVTGPLSRNVLHLMANMKALPEERKTILRKLVDPKSGETLDFGLIVWFPGPRSFSGEDMCELHVHGGMAVVASVENSLGKLPGFRPAEPGEFTKRAFLNGKLDLTQVEGLSDLLQAETQMQRHQALRQLDGSLSQFYSNWRERLKKCVANVEAFIDFGEDENIESDVLENVSFELNKLQFEMQLHLSDSRKGERVRSGVHIAITGKPNVGKSSLFNIICQREAAIVSPIPGTTRDIVHASLNIGGYPVHISDTAGIRDTQDIVEQEGVKRAKHCAAHSDLIIVMIEANDTIGNKDNEEDKVFNTVQSLLLNIETSKNESLDMLKEDVHQNVLIVINKLDDLNPYAAKRIPVLVEKYMKQGIAISVVSCRTEEGLEMFLKTLEEKIACLCGNTLVENPVLMQERHRTHLVKCLHNLEKYFYIKETDIVLAAYQLHKALSQLGRMTGKVTTDEILDVIFRDFCIGK